jgi:hypothetical protein
MSTTPDGTAARSWMQRAMLEDSSRPHPAGNGGTAASPPSNRPSQGWDPYEVWLTRIERPRRRRDLFCPAK